MRKRRPKIAVTAEHITAQTRADCYGCAIALAINDALGGAWWVCETRAEDHTAVPTRRRIRFAPRVRVLMRRLDRGDLVSPFVF